MHHLGTFLQTCTKNAFSCSRLQFDRGKSVKLVIVSMFDSLQLCRFFSKSQTKNKVQSFFALFGNFPSRWLNRANDAEGKAIAAEIHNWKIFLFFLWIEQPRILFFLCRLVLDLISESRHLSIILVISVEMLWTRVSVAVNSFSHWEGRSAVM